ncbi:MAG: 50S ribosomal protein L21, partial [Armatimonadota bacterium]
GAARHLSEGSSRMYAVIKAGGRQYRVKENDVLSVNRLEGEPGSTITLDQVLLIGGEAPKVGTPIVAGAKVEAEILRHKRGPKIRGFNYKAKKNVRRRWGHRQELTELRVRSIVAGKIGEERADGT